jgi:S-adenosylmethionine/arginine decarboxylase-like enzyme
LEQAAGGIGASEVESVFHPFSPGGLSGSIVIAKSHDTLHTWPKIGYAVIEAFGRNHRFHRRQALQGELRCTG